MRVEPELPTIAKFQFLKRRVGDYAMEALIRLWAHCQQNQRGEFWRGANAEYVELTAGWDGEPGLLFRSLLELRWVHEEEGGIRIHDWEEMNPQVVNNWKNGPKGGRPKKSNANGPNNPLVNQSQTSGVTTPELGLPAISGAGPNNPLVNPIPVSVNQSLTQCEPYQRNVTKQDLTRQNETDGSQKPEAGPSGMRYDLATAVIAFLNQQTGADFKGTRSEVDAIAACLLSVGNDFEGVKKMVARQAVLWLPEAKSAQWLQPRTLFDEEKFPGYFAMRNLPTDAVPSDPRQRRRELEEAIEKHPANRQSTFHNPNATEVERENLKKLRLELSQLGQKNAAQKVAAGSGV